MPVRNQIRIRRLGGHIKDGQPFASFFLGVGTAIQQKPIPVEGQFKTVGADLTTAAEHGKIDNTI
ncbi:MAG: hypothetical protein BWX80_03450 [Candidatus Hydrogenedentes bacterium ADurb.Bin101]|nr:MAG: hypothetical protein BWX80_03450 [Candidatus Hydrogenedentes bacterium ADurb.Bin101]